MRLALRQAGVVYYLLTDHLGSTALTVDGNGAKKGELRYKAWGETRYTWGTFPTDYRYTGQRQEEGLGLYRMGARWYDPALARWLSADTLVPGAWEPQALNRYSYVLGNPMKYIDPSGHKSRRQWEEEFRNAHNGQEPTEQDWWDYQFSLQIENWITACWEQTYALRSLLWNAEVTIVAGDVKWSITQVENIGEAVKLIGKRFGGDVRRFIGGVTVKMNSEVKPWFTKLYDPGGDYDGYEFWGTVYLEPDSLLSSIIHEMGHYFDEKKDHSLQEYKRYLREAGLPTRNASEDFAVAFANYVLCVPMNVAKEDYLNQLRVDEIPNAGGYVWP